MGDLLSRKFIGSMAVVILAYGLVFTGKLEAQVWLNMATVVMGIYTVGNVTQKAIKKE